MPRSTVVIPPLLTSSKGMVSMDWSSLTLMRPTPRGAVFSGTVDGARALVLRLIPSAVEPLRARLALRGRATPLGFRKVLGAGLDGAPAWVAVERAPATLRSQRPATLREALQIVSDVTDALEEAHRVGLIHGAVRPSSVGLDEHGRASLTFLGDDLDEDTERELEPRPPEHASSRRRPALDSFGLGLVIRAAVNGISEEAHRSAWLAWAERLMQPEPHRRPTVAEVATLLRTVPRQRRHDKLSRFELKDELRRGTTGALHGAIDPATNADVLVTHCTSELAAVQRQFAAAAYALSEVTHPSLPTTLDVVHDGPVVLFASKRVPGPSLAERLASDAVAADDVVRIAAAVASAVAALHDVRVVHGCISPEWVVMNGDDPVLLGVGCGVDAGGTRADVQALGTLITTMLGARRPTDALRSARDAALGATLTAEELAGLLFDIGGRPRAAPVQHPPAPTMEGVQSYTVTCDIPSATPGVVWNFVSNTERVNQVIGVKAAERRVEAGPGGQAVTHGRTRQAGFTLDWVEHPYEWVAGQRLGVLREYAQGPLLWLRSVVELEPRSGGGTHLVQTLDAKPRSLLTAPIVAAEIGFRVRRALEGVYRHIDEHLARGPETVELRADAFEDVQALEGAQERGLQAFEARVAAQGVDERAVAGLANALRFFPAQDLARLQPLGLAYRLGVDPEQMVTACLCAARDGLLIPGWDLLCPSCRIASSFAESLQALSEHGHCEACALAFAVDLSESLELVFRPHPSLRVADVNSYCLSSPAHSPHVVLQQTMAVDERLTVNLWLGPGRWELTRLGAPPVELEVEDDEELPTRAEVSFERPPTRLGLRAGSQKLTLHNDTRGPVRVRVASATRRATVLTAARAFVHPLFAAVFPNATFREGVALKASVVSVLAIGADEPARLPELVATAVSAGGLISGGDPAVVIFDNPTHAFIAALRVAQTGGRVSAEICSVSMVTSPELRCTGAQVEQVVAGLDDALARTVVAGPLLSTSGAVSQLAEALSQEGAVELLESAGAWGVRYRAR